MAGLVPKELPDLNLTPTLTLILALTQVGSLLPWLGSFQKEAAGVITPTQLLIAKVAADGLFFQARISRASPRISPDLPQSPGR